MKVLPPIGLCDVLRERCLRADGNCGRCEVSAPDMLGMSPPVANFPGDGVVTLSSNLW